MSAQGAANFVKLRGPRKPRVLSLDRETMPLASAGSCEDREPTDGTR